MTHDTLAHFNEFHIISRPIIAGRGELLEGTVPPVKLSRPHILARTNVCNRRNDRLPQATTLSHYLFILVVVSVMKWLLIELHCRHARSVEIKPRRRWIHTTAHWSTVVIDR